MQEWLEYNGLNSIVIATKIDLTPKSKLLPTINNLKKVTKREVLPFSINDKRYNEKILNYIENTLL